MLSASSWVASKSTGHPIPALTAASQVRAQTHHESPAFNPGKEKCGAGVMRSLPCCRAYSRKSSLTTQHTVCEPRSFSSVLQHPSRYQPVFGSFEHVCNSVPSTFIDGCMCVPLSQYLSTMLWRPKSGQNFALFSLGEARGS